MENKKQNSYNFSSVDLLIYMWNKRLILMAVGFLAAVTSIIVSLTITPMYSSSVIMFPASGASVAKYLISTNYTGRSSVYGFGEEEQAEQLLQVLHSEPIRTRIIEKYNLMEHYEIDPNGKYPRTTLHEMFSSNNNFRLTEYMSVEISVMDKDPVISAAIANDISDLVDTVFNDMKKKRALRALELVETEYLESQEDLIYFQDSIMEFGQALRAQIKTSGNPAKILGLNNKGHLGLGADADITVLNLETQKPVLSIANGDIVMWKGHVCGKGCRIITTPLGEAHVKEKGLQPVVVDPAKNPLCRRI